jgi:uncharacterized BrkB/YihY/UPF0761 family membrane protein
LVPILVLVGYVLGHFVRQKGARTLLEPLLGTAPEAVQSFLMRELERLGGTTSGAVAPIAALGFLWVASSGVHGLLTGLELALRVERRPFWHKRLLAIGYVLAGLLAVGLAGTVLANVGISQTDAPSTTPASGIDAPSSGTLFGPMSAGPSRSSSGAAKAAPKRRKLQVASELKLAGPVVLAVLSTLGLYVIYRYGYRIPKSASKRKPIVWPGVGFAIVLWLAITAGFGFYARTIASYSVYYGSIAAIAVLATWMWLTALCLLSGAELNVALQERAETKPKPPSTTRKQKPTT